MSQRGNTAEIDIEGIAVEGNTVYVIGSHAKVRARMKPGDSHRKNRERLEQAPKQDDEFRSRNTVARFSVDSNGRASTPQFTSLADILDNSMPFKLFRAMPSKENGIDIEGLAVKDGIFYAGFRGPVLRGNYVPVLVFGFDHPRQQMEVRYLNLCGRGVRDLARVDSGFLVLAGPLGDGPGSYQLYYWDGSDMVPGADHPVPAALRLLAELPITDDPSAKAEGMVVLSAQPNTYELLIVFDGIKDGGMRRYRVADAAASPRQLCEADWSHRIDRPCLG